MKYWKSTNMITNLKKLDVNVLEVALTHLIEQLKDTQNDEDFNLDKQLASAKAMYLALGNKSFWGEVK